MFTAMRQRRIPGPFRIERPELTAEQRTRLRQVIDALQAAAAPEATPAPSLDEDEVVRVATYLWRAQKTVSLYFDESSTREVRQLARHLRSSQESLSALGVRVQDHDNAEFDDRQGLQAMAFQDEPDLRVETVLQTVRPSVYLFDRLIQPGEVIVGRPAGPASGAVSAGEKTRSEHG